MPRVADIYLQHDYIHLIRETFQYITTHIKLRLQPDRWVGWGGFWVRAITPHSTILLYTTFSSLLYYIVEHSSHPATVFRLLFLLCHILSCLLFFSLNENSPESSGYIARVWGRCAHDDVEMSAAVVEVVGWGGMGRKEGSRKKLRNRTSPSKNTLCTLVENHERSERSERVEWVGLSDSFPQCSESMDIHNSLCVCHPNRWWCIREGKSSTQPTPAQLLVCFLCWLEWGKNFLSYSRLHWKSCSLSLRCAFCFLCWRDAFGGVAKCERASLCEWHDRRAGWSEERTNGSFYFSLLFARRKVKEPRKLSEKSMAFYWFRISSLSRVASVDKSHFLSLSHLLQQ